MTEQFRIESQVYSGDSNLPVSQNVTLFAQGIIYDFQMSNGPQPRPLETVIFDSRNRMMTLLDPDRQVKLELPELRLIKILDAVKRETANDPRSSFLVTDRFREDNDLATGWVTLESPQITYRFKGAYPTDATVLPMYNAFLNNYTRLIATDPSKIPPFARLELNQSIRRLGWIPSEVQITVRENALFRQEFSAKSKHFVFTELSNKDFERIAKAKIEWRSYKPVDLAEYRNLQKPGLALLGKGKKAQLLPDSKVVTASHDEPVIGESVGESIRK
ncbi:MAG: hypothetical protein P8J27_05375 [Mariniblastus sp.]|nr:hypothetical protein [Mariniblastus sp.]